MDDQPTLRGGRRKADPVAVAKLYLKGMSSAEIAGKFDVTERTVHRLITRVGVQPNRARPAKNKDAREFLTYRVWYLPKQIEATRRKLAALENEARRYGLHDLLGGRR